MLRLRPLAVSLLAAGCAAPCPPPPAAPPPVAVTPAPAAPPVATSAPPAREREKIAVLPLYDDRLFRAERAQLRELLASEVAKRGADLDVLPLPAVDAKLDQSRCAFRDAPLHRLARDQGWAPTDVMHVAGEPDKPEELWVDIDGWDVKTTLTAVWNPRLARVDRYRAAFTSMVRQTEAPGILGGLAASGSRKSALVSGGLVVCETQDFGICKPSSASFADVAPDLAKCFGADDENDASVLFDGPRCEIAGDAASSALEQCLCGAVARSAGARAAAGRRVLSIAYQAADLVGKPRPALSVLDASGNVFADQDSQSVKRADGGYSSYQRLTVDNLDALAAPLARCNEPKGAVIVTELELTSTGSVSRVRVASGAKEKTPAARCLDAALSHAAFSCTADGKPATLRVAARWPG